MVRLNRIFATDKVFRKESAMGTTKSKKCCTPPKPTPRVAGTAASRSSDGRLDIKLSSPGTAGSGTNPSSCSPLVGRPVSWSIKIAAGKMKVKFPAGLAIDAEVDLGTTGGASPRGSSQCQPAGGGSRSCSGPGGRAPTSSVSYSNATRATLTSRSTWSELDLSRR